MNWTFGRDPKNEIRILEKGITKKYIITNKSDIKVNTLNIISTNECRWVVNVKDLLTESYILEVFTLENKILETNNPSVHEVANFNNVFKEVYNELVLEVGFKGDLIAVRNASDIRRKWLQIREQLKSMEQNKESTATIINLNDGLFNSDTALLEVIKAMEFFELFFIGFYGNEMPVYNVTKNRGSKFRGVKMEWAYNFSQNDLNKYDTVAPCHIIKMAGAPNKKFNDNFIKEAYGQFDFLDYKKLNVNIHSNGEYFVDKKSGLLEKAVYINNEIIDENLLYSKNNYTVVTY